MAAVQLVTNLYPIAVSAGVAKVYTYDVQITPAPGSPIVVDRLLKGTTRQLREKLGSTVSTGQNVFAAKKITEELRVTINYKMKPRRPRDMLGGGSAAGATAQTKDREDQPEIITTTYNVVLVFTGEFNMASAEAKKVFVNTFIDRRVLPKIGLTPLGSSFIDKTTLTELGRSTKIRVWSGLSTAADVFAKGIAMRLDICHKVLRPETALDVLRQTRSLRSPASNDSRDFENEVVNRVIVTLHNQRTYRVKKVLWDENPLKTFRKRDRRPAKGPDADLQAEPAAAAAAAATGAGAGTVMTFRDYFQQQYNIKLQDDTQPLLLVEARRGARRVKLPAELCTLTGLSDAMRADFNLMRDMAQHTNLRSEDRARRADEWARKIAAQLRDKAFAEWGMSMDERPVRVDGAALPRLQYALYKHGAQAAVDVPTDGKELMFRDLGVVDRDWGGRPWTVVYGRRDARDVNEFLQKLNRLGTALGIQNMPPPSRVELNAADGREYEEFASRGVDPSQCMYLFVLMNEKSRNGYRQLKRALYTTLGVPCQCVCMKNVQTGNDSVLTKLLIQILSKRGLKAYFMSPPASLKARPTLVMGLDLEELEPRNRSHVIALASTRDAEFALHLSELGYAPTGRDVPATIAAMIAKTCERFRAGMGVVPERILLYRSGVSEGQLKTIVSTELQGVAEAVQQKLGKPVEINLVVVQKSGSIRFAAAGSMRNPAPGTLITKDVTVAGPYQDFYLISYAPKGAGAAVPTRYVVMQMDSHASVSAADLALFTYQQCAMYTNYSAGVRVPAPVALASRFVKLAVEQLFRGYRPEQGPPPVPVDQPALFLTQYYI